MILHVGKVVIIEIVCFVFFNIIGPNSSLNKRVTLSISQILECCHQWIKTIISFLMIFLKLFLSDFWDKHMANIPPTKACSTKQKQQYNTNFIHNWLLKFLSSLYHQLWMKISIKEDSLLFNSLTISFHFSFSLPSLTPTMKTGFYFFWKLRYFPLAFYLFIVKYHLFFCLFVVSLLAIGVLSPLVRWLNFRSFRRSFIFFSP